MRSLRLPDAPYHSSFTKIGDVTPAVTRLSLTSGVRPTASAIDPSALRYVSQRIVTGACLYPKWQGTPQAVAGLGPRRPRRAYEIDADPAAAEPARGESGRGGADVRARVV